MKKFSISSLIRIFVFLTMVMYITILAVGCLRTNLVDTKLSFQRPIAVMDGWVDDDGNSVLPKDPIILESGQSITISRAFTAKEYSKGHLAFRTEYLDIQVVCDDETIFMCNYEDETEMGTELGSVWYEIDLPHSLQDYDVYFHITNNTERRQEFDVDTISVGTRSDISYMIIKHAAFNLILALICFIIGIFVLIYSIVLKGVKLNKYVNVLYTLSWMAISAAAWIMTNSNFLQLYQSDSSMRYLTNYFSFMFFVQLLILFQREMLPVGKVFFATLSIAYFIWSIVAMSVYVVGMVAIRNLMMGSHIFMMLLVVAAGIGWIYFFFKTDSKSYKYAAVSNVVAVALAIVCLGLYYANVIKGRFSVYSVVIAAYVIYMFVFCLVRSFGQFADAKKLKHYRMLACTDPVTGGNSAVYLAEELPDEGEEGWYFVYLNIQKFNLINQMLSRKEGDALLRFIYACLGQFEERGGLLCYLGNADFGVYTHCSSLDEVLKILKWGNEKMAQELQEIYPGLGVSMQHVIYPSVAGKQNFDMIMDAVMMAKENPSAKYVESVNAYVYTEECKNKLLHEKQLEDGLDDAIKNEEFKVYLQPKVSATTGELVRTEALVRWKKSDGTIIPPGEFIPVFEKAGTVTKVDIFMFEKVCDLIKNWCDRGIKPVPVSVNVSKKVFSHPKLWERYFEILDSKDVPQGYIEFEFTESVAYENYAMVEEIISKIHDRGAFCSMDDFGKSYSNFNALSEVDFDAVKMDGCLFENGFPHQERKVTVIADMIGLFKNMGLDIVAEGIETKEQVDKLKEIGCDVIQGFYYSKPITIEEFEQRWLLPKNNRER